MLNNIISNSLRSLAFHIDKINDAISENAIEETAYELISNIEKKLSTLNDNDYIIDILEKDDHGRYFSKTTKIIEWNGRELELCIYLVKSRPGIYGYPIDQDAYFARFKDGKFGIVVKMITNLSKKDFLHLKNEIYTLLMHNLAHEFTHAYEMLIKNIDINDLNKEKINPKDNATRKYLNAPNEMRARLSGMIWEISEKLDHDFSAGWTMDEHYIEIIIEGVLMGTVENLSSKKNLEFLRNKLREFIIGRISYLEKLTA